MVGCFSGLTVSHTASLIAEKHQANGSNPPTVYACVSDHTNAQKEELQQTVTATGCKSRHKTCMCPGVFIIVLFMTGYTAAFVCLCLT